MVATTSATTDRETVLRRLIQSFVTGDAGEAQHLVTEDVVGWSPALFVTSRKDLLAAYDDRLDAFSNIDVYVDCVDLVRDKAIAEWHISADFTGTLEIDDMSLPPTGERVHLAGATFSEFDGAKVRSFRHYF